MINHYYICIWYPLDRTFKYIVVQETLNYAKKLRAELEKKDNTKMYVIIKMLEMKNE